MHSPGSLSWRYFVTAVFLSVGTLLPISACLAQKCLHENFRVDLVYAPPDIEHPSVVTCDDEGNLFVGEDPMDMRGPTSKHLDRIILIRWDKATGKPIRTVFAENLSAVFGMVWHQGSLYVMHAPLYSVLRDTDGDGVADERKDLAKGFGPDAGVYGFNDHIVTGTRLGMDGSLYVSVGDKGVPKAIGADGSTITLEGGGVVKMRLDGTQLEVVTSGTRNHLDVAMDSYDNIFTYDNTDDGLGWWTRFTHHVPSGYYGYPYDYLRNPQRHLPRISEHGGGSPVGAACYREAAWPAKYRDAAFHCEWGKQKVQVFYPKKQGATFTAQMEDFLVKEGTEEFRPQDLCFSPDGKHMYVGDWNFGGWVNPKICGRLFRVTYTGRDVAPEPPRGNAKSTFREQLAALGHPAHSERMRAQQMLIAYPDSARVVEALKTELQKVEDSNSFAKIHAIWTLFALTSKEPPAALALQLGASAKAVEVRSQTARALGMLGEAEGVPVLAKLIKDADPQPRMWAAIGLGRMPADAVDSKLLYEALADEDSFVRHTAQQALRKLQSWKLAQEFLKSKNSVQRQATLVALSGVYHPDAIAALIWAASQHPDISIRAGAVQALTEVHRQADPYEKGWWGTQPAKGKPARSKTREWSETVQVLAALRAALESPEASIRQVAMQGVGEVKDPLAFPILLKLATDEKQQDQTRKDAVITLASNQAPQAKDAAEHILNSAQSAGPLLEGALQAARLLKKEELRSAIEKQLVHVSVEVRLQALEAVVALGGNPAPAHVAQALRDIDPSIRKVALRISEEKKYRELLPLLIELAAQTDLQQDAILALSAMPDVRSVGAFLQGITSKNNDLRVKSRAALTLMKNEISEEILARHQRNELTPEMRRELQAVFLAPAPIKSWHLVGPYFKDKGEPVFAGEQAPDLSQPFDVQGKNVPWKKVETDAAGRLSPGNHLQPVDGVWSLAYAAIESPSDQNVGFALGSDDQARLFVNGKKVFEHLGNRGWTAAQDKGSLALKKGTNHLYFVCGNTSGPWDFSLGLLLPNEKFSFLHENTPPQLDPAAYRDFALKQKGDAARGQQLFFDLKGIGCVKCHAVAGKGEKIGPDLVGLGIKYPREELIRSILEPSARVADSYQVTMIRKADGQIIEGLIKTDGDQMVELVTSQGKVVTIPVDEIEARKKSGLSLMPNGLKDGMSLQDFTDLVSYLESLKEAAPALKP